MIKYRIDILDELKKAGYTTTRLRKEGIIGEGTLTRIRQGKMISLDTLDVLCLLLACKPMDILEYTPEDIDSI